MFITTICCAAIHQQMAAQIVASKSVAGSTGFIDAKGAWVVRPKYYGGYWDRKQLMGHVNDAMYNYGLIDETGKEILPLKYKWIQINDKYLQTTTKDGLCGLYYHDGRQIYDDKYGATLYPTIDNKFILLNMGGHIDSDNHTIGGKWGIGDTRGKVIIPAKYDYVHYVYHAQDAYYYAVSNDGHYNSQWEYTNGKKWGLYKDEKLVIPCEYDSIEFSFHNHLHAIKKNGKWGFFHDGKEIIPPEYDEVTLFSDGVATVIKDGEAQMIKNPLMDGNQIELAQNNIDNTKEVGAVKSRYPAPHSDVDTDIPTTPKSADNTFAIIIANENYADAPVPYALNDGRIFKEYCQHTLGLPEKHINLYEDATYGSIINAVEKMKDISDAYDGEARFIFYYAGHGFPDDKQATAWILPVDGITSAITTTGYSLAKLYDEIAHLKMQSAIVLIDACFSGAKREDQMLASSRGVAIKVKAEQPQGKMLIFSAATGDETAHQIEEKGHGLFTYYLLKKLKSTNGDVDMGSLTDYVTTQVKRQSVVINNKKQTPTVIPSQALMNNWQTMKLK